MWSFPLTRSSDIEDETKMPPPTLTHFLGRSWLLFLNVGLEHERLWGWSSQTAWEGSRPQDQQGFSAGGLKRSGRQSLHWLQSPKVVSGISSSSLKSQGITTHLDGLFQSAASSWHKKHALAAVCGCWLSRSCKDQKNVKWRECFCPKRVEAERTKADSKWGKLGMYMLVFVFCYFFRCTYWHQVSKNSSACLAVYEFESQESVKVNPLC